MNDKDPYTELREQMVQEQLRTRAIRDERLLSAFETIPRHLFVPERWREHSYEDRALPLGRDETISQPYTIAIMLESVRLQPGDRVLEVGAGSGYVLALLSHLVEKAFGVEIDSQLVDGAAAMLAELELKNVAIRQGDGAQGIPEEQPFDAIIVSAACDQIPRDLVRQLAENGRMILPLGEDSDAQELVLMEKTADGLEAHEIGGVRFVPLRSEKN